MFSRRRFMGWLKKSFLAGALAGPFLVWPARVSRAAKRWLVPKGTSLRELINREPRDLDTSQLEITPLQDFRTMGQTEYKPDLDQWRLELTGEVDRSMSLSYQEIRKLPPLEKKVLLICPGVFTQVGLWQGFSLAALLKQSGLKLDDGLVMIEGPSEGYTTTKYFPLAEVLADKVFLAHSVNGDVLPERHGYPIRVVAEDFYGADWVKYVYKVTVLKEKP